MKPHVAVLLALCLAACGATPRPRTVEGRVVITEPEHPPDQPATTATDVATLPPFTKRAGVPCGGKLGPAASFADFVAPALLPAWDSQTKHAVVQRKGEAAGVPESTATDCLGHTQAAFNSDPGAVEVFVKKLSLPLAHPFRDGADEVALAWVYLGATVGLCAVPQGFLAVVQRRGDLMEILASTAWEGSCKTEDGAATVLDVAGKPAIVQVEGDAGEERVTGSEARIYGLVGRDLSLLGEIPVVFEETRAPFAFAGVRRTMRASLESHPLGVVAKESWSFEAKAGARTKVVPRVYELRKGKLTTPKTPPPAP